jgi:cholera toxin transcriptional activator
MGIGYRLQGTGNRAGSLLRLSKFTSRTGCIAKIAKVEEARFRADRAPSAIEVLASSAPVPCNLHPVPYKPVPISKYRFGPFEADLKAAELRKDGARLRLQLQPFQVLVTLLESPREVVTREQLRQRLWPQDTFVDFDHGLNTAINKLRDVLGDSAANPRYVETIAKRGYRFLGDVTAIQDQAGKTTSFPVKTSASEAAGTQESSAHAVPQPQESELPRASRRTARMLFALAQIMYLIFYMSALFRLERLDQSAHAAWDGAGHIMYVLYLFTALVGIAVRLYLATATAFDYHLFGEKYRVLFPALFALDMFWALSPFLIADRIGLGLALGATAALIYMPFAQRVLVRMIAARA